jgi:thiol-disulfide isomerase/thioredoxin
VRRLLVALLAAVALAGCTTPTHETRTLPRVTLASFDGRGSTDLASLKGPLVVNLWASWCGPCRREMPLLQAFSRKYAGRVRVLGVDYQDPQTGAARRLVERSGVTYDLLSDPGGALDGRAPFPALRGLPFLALVDRSGRVVHSEFVALRSLDQLERLVRRHLGVAS